MGTKTRKVKSAGRFGARYGKKVRERVTKVELKQRKKQQSPFHPQGVAKRIAAGIWKCSKTGKTFADNAYYIGGKD
jgi:large subunit ribosomal protein L37Ae